MEQNNQQNMNVKEKSVYLLHLDGPRILILSAIIIGLLSIAFLVGMKFMGEGKSDDSLARNDAYSDQHALPPSIDDLDPTKSTLPDLQTTQPLSSQAQPLQDSAVPQSSTQTVNTPSKNDSDILSPNTVHEVVPSSKPVAKEETKTVKTTKVASKKQPTKKQKVSKKDTTSVVEVSSGKQKSDKKTAHGFFVQCASLDKIDKAKSEVKKLKNNEYDAFYDRKEVNGKDFYRVRIGPIATKEKALQMLEEIQQNPRYEESFIIHE